MKRSLHDVKFLMGLETFLSFEGTANCSIVRFHSLQIQRSGDFLRCLARNLDSSNSKLSIKGKGAKYHYANLTKLFKNGDSKSLKSSLSMSSNVSKSPSCHIV